MPRSCTWVYGSAGVSDGARIPPRSYGVRSAMASDISFVLIREQKENNS